MEQAAEQAYEKLNIFEKADIDCLCDIVIAKMRMRWTNKVPPKFGRKQARELLAALGIWMIKNPKFQVI